MGCPLMYIEGFKDKKIIYSRLYFDLLEWLVVAYGNQVRYAIKTKKSVNVCYD